MLTLNIIIILFLVYLKSKNKKWNDPYIAFNILWLCVCFLLNIGNEFVYKPSNLALNCIILGIVGFNISLFIPEIKFNKIEIKEKIGINQNTLLLISSVVMILSLYNAINSIEMFLAGNSFVDIREGYYTYNENILAYYARNYILAPLRYFILTSTIVIIFKEKRIKKILLINALIIVASQALISGGRYILLNTMLMLVCGFFMFLEGKISYTKKGILILFISIFSYIVIYLTNERATFQSLGMTTIQRLYLTIYQYFAGSVTYLGVVIEQYPFVAASTYGVNFMAGFLSPVFAFFTFIHLINYPDIFNIIGIYACDVLKIGPSTYYNALPTAFGYFYIDGGYTMTFIESFLFGYICKNTYKRAILGDFMFISIYILIFVQICNMSTRWFFYNPEYALSYMYIYLINRYKKYRIII